LQSHNDLSIRHLHKWQLFAVDNYQVAALRLAVFHNFRPSAIAASPFAATATADEPAKGDAAKADLLVDRAGGARQTKCWDINRGQAGEVALNKQQEVWKGLKLVEAGVLAA
jgi:hypothetical protein